MISSYKQLAWLIGLLALLVLTIWIVPRVSSVTLDDQQQLDVLTKVRIPRLQLAMLAGAGLALAGMTFQAIFRNPLATEFTLGVSSGSSLAMAIGLATGIPIASWGTAGQIAIAFIGALIVVLIVYAIAELQSESPTATLLLGGVCINFICGAGIILVQYLIQEHESKQIIFWLIGSVEAASPDKWKATRVVAVILIVGTLILIRIHRELDLLMMSEIVAASRGVDVRRTRALAYFAASLITAGIVSICGPIAFVGLVVPHIMRSLIGPSHRWLLPACILFGMSFLPICDCIARNFIGWTSSNNFTELPVGVVTNVLGGVFFLILLIRQKAERPILA